MTGSAHVTTTFWRRVVLARIRVRQLARTEIPASLAALARAALVVRPADG